MKNVARSRIRSTIRADVSQRVLSAGGIRTTSPFTHFILTGLLLVLLMHLILMLQMILTTAAAAAAVVV